jgi:hypothetical protein
MTRSGITAKIGSRAPDKMPDKMKEAQLVRHLNFPASAEEHPYRRPRDRGFVSRLQKLPARCSKRKMLNAEDGQWSGSGAAPYRPCRHT